MVKSLKQLDAILRGDATRVSALREGEFRIPVAGMTFVIVALGVLYGMCMGAFALIRTGGVEADAYKQFFASGVKLPMLFIFTLGVTFPSLYVFNALMGSRLSMIAVLRLLIAAMSVMLAVLASLGPIVVFFSVSTTSYPFMVLLNVAACTVCGILGLAFLLRTLHRLVTVQDWLETAQRVEVNPLGDTRFLEAAPVVVEAGATSLQPDTTAPVAELSENQSDGTIMHASDSFGALDRGDDATSTRARMVFNIWVIVFALVGGQMSWVLRPFIGHPGQPFEFFRERGGNFFIAVFKALAALFAS